MGLDILVIFENGDNNNFVMSGELHSEIFSSSTRWSSFKELKKIKDYYKVDINFNSKCSNSFLSELVEIRERIKTKRNELDKLIINLDKRKIKKLRITGD